MFKIRKLGMITGDFVLLRRWSNNNIPGKIELWYCNEKEATFEFLHFFGARFQSVTPHECK